MNVIIESKIEETVGTSCIRGNQKYIIVPLIVTSQSEGYDILNLNIGISTVRKGNVVA